MTPEEIRIRRMANQHLLEPSDTLTVIRDLCGVQAQFMSNALHSLKIRCADYDEATVSQGLVKKWLSQLPVASAECEGRTYFHIGSGRDVGCGLPPCVFLAGFDQLMLAYEKKESLYLRTEHLRSVFNLAGIVMPTVLLNGSVAGRWKKKSGKLTVELFAPVSSGEKRLIRTCADALWEDLRTLDIA